ncbi:NIF3 NGG1 interactin-like proteing factor 3-like 1 [Xylogone sp. PMI_703]|nr:NIF3 NGG1 interactin-like proteing factor 3-like 1 [Xylogone sp. PMI_703]
MASSTPNFSASVINAVKSLYPDELADKSFDNTGLLLEAPPRSHSRNHALLTIDLTKAVADEAIEKKSSIIVAYHPIIFRPLKALTSANSQQSSLLRLAQEGISVYSPHTAVDASPGGLNDWLAEIVIYGGVVKEKEQSLSGDNGKYEVSVIKPSNDPPQGFEGAGHGRIVKFHSPEPLGTIVSRITAGLCVDYVSVAVPQSVSQGDKSNIPISSIGICAGSGGSLLNGLDVDLLFTGELDHHSALAAIERGKVVVTAFHSNTERAYLSQRMARYVSDKLSKDGISGEVEVSKADRDPYEIVAQSRSQW